MGVVTGSSGYSEIPANTYVVGASEFGGPHDSSTHGDSGSCGKHLTGKSAFAELYMGNALGHLPCGTKLIIQLPHGGKQGLVAEKLDIGAGGAPVQGHARRVDLWWETARQLGFSGTGLITIRRVDGKPITGPMDTGGGTTTGAGVLGTGVGPNTEKEGDELSEKFKEGVEGAISWASELGKILSFLDSSQGWIRIGKVLLGATLMLIAIDQLTKIGPTPNTNVKGSAVKLAEKVK